MDPLQPDQRFHHRFAVRVVPAGGAGEDGEFAAHFVEQDRGRQTDGDGFGLLGMRERLALVDGELAIRSAPGEGTTVTARIPVVRAAVGARAAPPGPGAGGVRVGVGARAPEAGPEPTGEQLGLF